jgi:LysR family transcriptional regulator, glycine cleavage system transcriptional activator
MPSPHDFRELRVRSIDDLPPLLSLRAFEAAGRLQSFSKAGRELLISQSAVSHHVRQLEASLGTALFVREARGVRLTVEGANYFNRVQRGFDEILAGTAAVRAAGRRSRGILRLSVVPVFAYSWLIPRLDDWRRNHPDIELLIDPTLRVVDVEAGETDLAIRYGDGSWPQATKELVLPERLSPVVSPKALKGRSQRLGLSELVTLPRLLNSSRLDWDIWLRWIKWSAPANTELNLTDYNLVVQAAVDGQGLAMGRLSVIAEHLQSGSLIMPINRVAKPRRYGYWLVRPSSRKTETAEAFRTWLTAATLREPVARTVRSDI